MKLSNNWFFIGRIYDNPQKMLIDKNEFSTKITIVVEHPYRKEKRMLISLIASPIISDKVANLCRVGDVIFASGEFVTSVNMSKYTSNKKISSRLVMSNFYILSKAKKQRLSDVELQNIVKTYSPEEFIVPKKRKLEEKQ